ncbi:MAG: laccase domain-containing protein, partial [Firmicutes bacterium]|nr:laccase domain-containing protein [Bacillota bacterium]
MDIRIFEDKGITAGLSQAPDLSDARRAEMAAEAEKTGGYVIRPRLTHGIRVAQITRGFLEGKPSYIEIDDCDGAVTDLERVTLTSTHGDCIPIYAADSSRGVIGLAHAGWRGTADGIAAVLVSTMISGYGCRPQDISVYIGPGIGRCHFEVSEDVAEEFIEKLSWCEDYIDEGVRDGKYMIDLKGINAELVKMLGIT